MSGFCGWVHTPITRDTREETLLRMTDKLPPMGSPGPHHLSDASAIGIRSQFNISVLSRNGVTVYIHGQAYYNAENREAQVDNTTIHDLYSKYGTECCQHIRGSYAIVIIDANENRTILAIDRIGTQALYYSTTGNGMVFGSSAGSVLCHPNVPNEIDPQAVYDYVYFHMVPSPRCIYSHVRKLEPAQTLVFENDRIKLEKHWLPDFNENVRYPITQLKQELVHSLNSVVKRCHPDEKTGAFLSGGLDSSTVSGVLAGNSDKPTQVFSIGFDEKGYDETAYARAAAKHFGNNMTTYYVTPEDVADSFSKVARAYDEPFGNSSAIPAYFCAQLASQHGITTLLAGDGGDELFAGNERYATQKLFDLYTKVPGVLRKGFLEPVFTSPALLNSQTPIRKIGRYIEQARVQMPERMETYNFLHRSDINKIFNPEFLAKINPQAPVEHLTAVYNQAPSQSLLNRMLYLDWKITLADNDLRKVNRMCEIAGVNVQYPLLDDELVQFSAKVPPQLKLKRFNLRYFFRWALKDFLPQEVLSKHKHGFGLPFGQWLRTSKAMQDIIYADLIDLKNRDIFDPDFIDQLISQHETGHAAYFGTMIWILAMLERWFKEHSATL